ncbi:MAG: PH domain-containing protein [Phycisphaerales bacterium]
MPETRDARSDGDTPSPTVDAPRAMRDECAMSEADAITGAGAGGAGAATLNPATANVPVDLLGDEEIIIFLLKPSPLYIVLSSLGVLVAAAFIVLLLAFLSQFEFPFVRWTQFDAIVFGALLVGARLIWQALDWWNQTYILTDRRVLALSGILRRRVFQAPLRNIQHLAVVVSIRERLFGLGTLAFATAGSDTYEAAWLMVPKPYTIHRKVMQTIDRYGRNHPT